MKLFSKKSVLIIAVAVICTQIAYATQSEVPQDDLQIPEVVEPVTPEQEPEQESQPEGEVITPEQESQHESEATPTEPQPEQESQPEGDSTNTDEVIPPDVQPPEDSTTNPPTEPQEPDTGGEEGEGTEGETPEEPVNPDIFHPEEGDKTMDLPGVDKIPDGYDFIGWNSDKDAKEGFMSCKIPEENMVLYAIWEEKQPEVPDTPEPPVTNESTEFPMEEVQDNATPII